MPEDDATKDLPARLQAGGAGSFTGRSSSPTSRSACSRRSSRPSTRRSARTFARIIRDYVQRNDSRCILLTATPYNKTYQDLSGQLCLFFDDDDDLGVRPEAYLRSLADGGVEFPRRHEAPLRSIKAFEVSDEPDDWRELMHLFLVRRTRSFVKEHYAHADCAACDQPLASACPACGAPACGATRRFLRFPDGTRSYFPDRVPKTVAFSTDDPYARLYDGHVVDTINALKLPRYGLAGVVRPSPAEPVTPAEQLVRDGLGLVHRAPQDLAVFVRALRLLRRLRPRTSGSARSSGCSRSSATRSSAGSCAGTPSTRSRRCLGSCRPGRTCSGTTRSRPPRHGRTTTRSSRAWSATRRTG